MTTQLGPYPQSPTGPEVINLGLGQPSPGLLPLAQLADAARARLRADGDPLLLQYGTVRGHPDFRAALAELLHVETGVEASSETLSLTGGTSLGLSMVAQSLARPGAVVACGDPTYFLAPRIFAEHGLQPFGVPVDADGMQVEALETALRGGQAIALAYVIPAFHNPCGICLAPDRAEKLVALAEEFDFYVLADEPYTMLHFAGAPPSMMQYDRGRGRVVSLGTFSKILGPGLRLGWVHSAPELQARLARHGVLESGGGPNPIVSEIVQGLLDNGFLGSHMQRLRTTFASRAGALCDLLDAQLPQLQYLRPAGGYFVWGRLAEGLDTTALLAVARSEHGVAFTPGDRCAVSRDLSAALRFSFAFYEPEELAEGVSRLARALSHHR